MPRPRSIIETSDPLGVKLNEVMAEKHMAGDYAKLARAFGVTTASAREWVKYGRLSKDRFPVLVQWSGRSLHWWFDVTPDVQMVPVSGSGGLELGSSLSTPPLARERSPEYHPSWPFETITPSDLKRLPRNSMREIETFARWILSQQKPAKSTA